MPYLSSTQGDEDIEKAIEEALIERNRTTIVGLQTSEMENNPKDKTPQNDVSELNLLLLGQGATEEYVRQESILETAHIEPSQTTVIGLHTFEMQNNVKDKTPQQDVPEFNCASLLGQRAKEEYVRQEQILETAHIERNRTTIVGLHTSEMENNVKHKTPQHDVPEFNCASLLGHIYNPYDDDDESCNDDLNFKMIYLNQDNDENKIEKTKSMCVPYVQQFAVPSPPPQQQQQFAVPSPPQQQQQQFAVPSPQQQQQQSSGFGMGTIVAACVVCSVVAAVVGGGFVWWKLAAK